MHKFIENILRKIYHFVRPTPPQHANFEYSGEFWNRYEKRWKKKRAIVQNVDISEDEKESYLQHLGDEWGRVSDIEKIVGEYIYPFVDRESIVAEIGVGGGRIASRVVNNVKELCCFDISSNMLKRAKSALVNCPNVNFVLLKQPEFPERFIEQFDFVYSFDVFVHFDLHTMWKYFKEIKKVLKEGGKAFLHTTNLKAPDGWENFSKHKAYNVIGHNYISPEIINILSEHSNFRIIKKSSADPTNFYLNRDYLFILEKGQDES